MDLNMMITYVHEQCLLFLLIYINICILYYIISFTNYIKTNSNTWIIIIY